MEKTKEQLLATEIANGVNTFSFDSKAFCEAMGREHRTLQESFTRWLVRDWLLYNAERPDYEFDGRNEAVRLIAREFKEKIENDGLPMI